MSQHPLKSIKKSDSISTGSLLEKRSGTTSGEGQSTRRGIPPWGWLVIGALFAVVFYPVIKGLVLTWNGSEEYSHGFLIVPVSLWVIWMKRHQLRKIPFTPWSGGLAMIIMALVLHVLASYAAILTLGPLAMILLIHGMVLYFFGPVMYRRILFSLLFLFLMVPIPSQIYSAMTIPLQLLVTQISTFIGGVVGIPILRQGNLIHLPEKTLQVVQACSGLRSIMALSALSALFGYLTMDTLVFRTLLFLSSIPIAIVVNIVRVVLMITGFYFFNYDLTTGIIHTVMGLLIFFIALLLLYSLSLLFAMVEGRAMHKQVSDGALENTK
ncbi:MAG: exosortase [Desulfobacterium sp.]